MIMHLPLGYQQSLRYLLRSDKKFNFHTWVAFLFTEESWSLRKLSLISCVFKYFYICWYDLLRNFCYAETWVYYSANWGNFVISVIGLMFIGEVIMRWTQSLICHTFTSSFADFFNITTHESLCKVKSILPTCP